MSTIHIDRLKPHPKNAEYFADIDGEKYEELKRSIATHGIRDPLKITPDGTVIAGHQRLRIARELGFEQVPVVIYDVPPEEAEYLLIADNEERRSQDDDPIRKAKRAKFLKEYWGVHRGVNQYSRVNQNGESPKTSKDIAEAVGTDAAHLPRLLKLNDLIPELQTLVSASKLGTTAAEQLAHLTPDEQRALFQAFGEAIGERTVAEAKEIRRQIEEERRLREAAEKRVRELEGSLQRLTREIEAAKDEPAALRAALEDTQRELEQARRELAERPRIEVVSEEIKRALDDLRKQNDELKASLAEQERLADKLRKEKAAALEAKRQAEDEAIKERLARQRLEKTFESAGNSEASYAALRNLESKLYEVRQDVAGMLAVWEPESVSDEVRDHFVSVLYVTAEALTNLAKKCEGVKSNNVLMFRRDR
ncbi:ParB/RepB/Spo0J family partition protein [Alicyclobacillus acidocaldarius]|uniref:ParB domain protein nuclease n=1 Tax=Alicyclobacillus acidocaldarius subsp. acidocaldarius (strain ATCC 27009 / DSM 446 / BCRC 14685 / JCM 5260 / KCTC 1825 / NBRC 15652 / NCIMB 11725 / NRRL B-14509 / 104-IA) TaxID=521098 RepID=C8WVR0_ALIAD|nr:ParB N-terminal domain-containing protein [Alicyclobacillus acidocaldarius]ACV58182.1 ParB domain protein nuclease [Alicyclobacillus acidocaldarius subsp. acidocaldarius DSM 446]